MFRRSCGICDGRRGDLSRRCPHPRSNIQAATVRLVVPFAAGGTGDIVARVLSDRLAQSLGQSVVVENRPGATGAIGSKVVLSAAPDGHTLLVGQTGEMAINQHWSKGLGYDPVADFQPVALATVVPLALGRARQGVVFLGRRDARGIARRAGLSFASAGAATPGHLSGELLKLRTKSNMNHVPYNGAGPALNDILGGHVDHVLLRLSAGGAAREGRDDQAARGVHGQALGRRAGRADGRRGERHQGFRHRAVAGIFRAARHAARDRHRGCMPRSTRRCCCRT